MAPKVLFIIGPTAVGKSKVALQIATELHGEIISADSMQIYKGMDIGTAKPSVEERHKAPHHMIDVATPEETFSVYDYCTHALTCVNQIIQKKKLPIVVGGTGLYIRAFRKGLLSKPGSDECIRQRLEQLTLEEGVLKLHECLKMINPLVANQIKPADKRRIIRALEIEFLKEKNATDKSFKGLEMLGFDVFVIGIARERKFLYDLINHRVEQMSHEGLIDEVDRLRQQPLSKTAAQALGYKEWFSALSKCSTKDLPDNEKAKIINEIQTKTRQYAKRQLTWFRKDDNVHWFTWGNGENFNTFYPKVKQAVRQWQLHD